MADPFANFGAGLDAPAQNHAAVAPNDSEDLATIPRAIWVGTGGDVALIMKDASTAETYKNVPSGTLLPFRVKRVMFTNTTAQDIKAVW